MTSPVREFQAAIYTALNADAALMAIAKGVYDRVPKKPEFPYISFGVVTYVDDSSECYVSGECTMLLHVWSRDVGAGEMYDLADLAKRTLHLQTPVIADNAMSELRVDAVRYLDDPDGLTSHAVLSVSCRIEEI